MEKNKKKKKKVLSVLVLLLLVLAITIGYAVLSQTLTITGTSTISNPSWDVHFENVQVASGSVPASVAPVANASDKKTTLTYTVNLTVPGDYYEFTVDVVNGGNIDAKLNSLPSITGPTPAQDVYTNYSFTETNGSAITLPQTIAANGGSKTYKVRVEFDSNIESTQLPASTQNMTLVASMDWVQA